MAARKTSRSAKPKNGAQSTRSHARGDSTPRRWSKRVTEKSDALDVQAGLFRERDPRRIALSLKRSAERSVRRKAEPFRSAMSMLTFYINRGGRNLSAPRKRVLERAKTELRRLYGKEEA